MGSLRRDDGRGKPLRLLWVIDSLAMGGAERLAVAFARDAAAAGVDLRVCCLKRIGGNPLERELRETGVPCEVLEARNLRDWRAFNRLCRVLRAGRFDIVHAHLMYATLWGLTAARMARVPLVATLHVPPSTARVGLRQRLRELGMCRLLNRSDATIVAVSAALRDRYTTRGLLDPSRVLVVHNGIDTDRCPTANPDAALRLRHDFALPADAPVLLSTAVLRERRKGLHVLLDALPHVVSTCPGARLIVVGDGPLKLELEAQARALGVDQHVRWAGARTDVQSLLAGADLFVHPALDDPFPTVVLEAMAAALPVVATRVDGVPEMIADGSNGRLVPPSDPRALAAALSSLLDDPEARSTLGAAARRTALDRFSTGVWLGALRAVYSRALEPASAAPPSRDPGRVVTS